MSLTQVQHQNPTQCQTGLPRMGPFLHKHTPCEGITVTLRASFIQFLSNTCSISHTQCQFLSCISHTHTMSQFLSHTNVAKSQAMPHSFSRASVQPRMQSHTQTGFTWFSRTRTHPTQARPHRMSHSVSLAHIQRHTQLHSRFPLSLPVLSGLAGSTGNNQHSRKPQGLGFGDPREIGFPGPCLQPPVGP